LFCPLAAQLSRAKLTAVIIIYVFIGKYDAVVLSFLKESFTL